MIGGANGEGGKLPEQVIVGSSSLGSIKRAATFRAPDGFACRSSCRTSPSASALITSPVTELDSTFNRWTGCSNTVADSTHRSNPTVSAYSWWPLNPIISISSTVGLSQHMAAGAMRV